MGSTDVGDAGLVGAGLVGVGVVGVGVDGVGVDGVGLVKAGLVEVGVSGAEVSNAGPRSSRILAPSIRAAWLLGLWLAVAGCGTATGPQLVEATGLVTLSGAPVEGATVFFHPAKPSAAGKTGSGKTGVGKTSIGETDAEGRFSVQTHIKAAGYESGIAAGDYLVTVEKLEGEQRTSTLTPPKNTLPQRYRNPQTSKLTATVSADGANDFEFALQP